MLPHNEPVFVTTAESDSGILLCFNKKTTPWNIEHLCFLILSKIKGVCDMIQTLLFQIIHR